MRKTSSVSHLRLFADRAAPSFGKAALAFSALVPIIVFFNTLSNKIKINWNQEFSYANSGSTSANIEFEDEIRDDHSQVTDIREDDDDAYYATPSAPPGGGKDEDEFE